MDKESNKNDKDRLRTKHDVILEYDKWDFYDRLKKIENKNKGKLKLFDYDVTPLKDGRTMYFVMVKYQVYRRRKE